MRSFSTALLLLLLSPALAVATSSGPHAHAEPGGIRQRAPEADSALHARKADDSKAGKARGRGKRNPNPSRDAKPVVERDAPTELPKRAPVPASAEGYRAHQPLAGRGPEVDPFLDAFAKRETAHPIPKRHVHPHPHQAKTKRIPSPEPIPAVVAHPVTKRDANPDPPDVFRAALKRRDHESFIVSSTSTSTVTDPEATQGARRRDSHRSHGMQKAAKREPKPNHDPRSPDPIAKRAPVPAAHGPNYAAQLAARNQMEKLRRSVTEQMKGRALHPDNSIYERGVAARAGAQYPYAVSRSAPRVPTAVTDGYFYGASSYYLFALADVDRREVLDQLAAGGFKVVRIFVASVARNNKGSNNVAVNDVEPRAVGVYDDTILRLIDQLMFDCSVRGLKLLIALSDRYALGFWSTDAYALEYDVVHPGTTGAQHVADASNFYTSSDAVANFDKRISHILAHNNTLLGGKSWAELDSVIWGFEAQNEPQGYMPLAAPSWSCARSTHIESLLPPTSTILISSGGGITLSTSLNPWATACPSIDIISVHDYGSDAAETVSALLEAASEVGTGKKVIMGEWGCMGPNKTVLVKDFVEAFEAGGISWMYWEVVKPGKGASDFEIWTDDPAWAALTGGTTTGGATSASERYATSAEEAVATSIAWRADSR